MSELDRKIELLDHKISDYRLLQFLSFCRIFGVTAVHLSTAGIYGIAGIIGNLFSYAMIIPFSFCTQTKKNLIALKERLKNEPDLKIENYYGHNKWITGFGVFFFAMYAYDVYQHRMLFDFFA